MPTSARASPRPWNDRGGRVLTFHRVAAGRTAPMTTQRSEQPRDLKPEPKAELKSSRQIYDESLRPRRQVDDQRPRQSEDDQQREQFGPRGVLGQPDPAKMVPQRRKKTPSDFDPGHTA